MMESDWNHDAILRLYEDGRALQALRLGEEALPLRQWPGADGRILAARVASRLGGERLARALILRARRAEPTHARVHYYHASYRLSEGGAHAAWELLRGFEPPTDADATLRADFLALRASLLATFRDFERAEAVLGEADSLAADRPWLLVTRSHVLELEDEYAKALDAAFGALELQPTYVPALAQAAHLLHLQGRAEDAVDLCGRALETVEAVGLSALRATLLRELGREDETWAELDRAERLAALADSRFARWIAGERSRLAFLRGDDATALEFARLVETGFHRRLADSLEARPEGRRRLLRVPFVRQHERTCGPATLTALGRYFGESTEHLDVVERICYGGTSNYSERAWAEQNGFVAREFTITEEGAQALLDRGLPFAFSTVEASSGHMQAVVGYDSRRRSLLVRDPWLPYLAEWHAPAFLAQYRSSGPRALLIVPRSRASELDGLALSDAELHDHGHAVEDALSRHDLEAAYVEYHALRERAPEHLLTRLARLALCNYEHDALGRLAAVELLLEAHPDAGRFLLLRLMALRELGRRAERIAFLRDVVRRPGSDPCSPCTSRRSCSKTRANSTPRSTSSSARCAGVESTPMRPGSAHESRGSAAPRKRRASGCASPRASTSRATSSHSRTSRCAPRAGSRKRRLRCWRGASSGSDGARDSPRASCRRRSRASGAQMRGSPCSNAPGSCDRTTRSSRSRRRARSRAVRASTRRARCSTRAADARAPRSGSPPRHGPRAAKATCLARSLAGANSPSTNP
ncbi:MAG: C39 family peptidase [Planctomycetes bacterium]|nr:C39 family peptidase [Planctomycetota bacterium]